jgi:hypothetical protein
MRPLLFWLILSVAGGLALCTDLLGGNGIFTSANLNQWNNQLQSTTLEILQDTLNTSYGLKITKSVSTEIDISKSLIYAFPESKPKH